LGEEWIARHLGQPDGADVVEGNREINEQQPPGYVHVSISSPFNKMGG
jgi:hypothetical protein